MLDTLRTGDWLTLSRARLWAIAVLIASAAGLVYLVTTSDGLNDYQGRPLGTDFSNTYVAGKQVLDGHPEAPFDPRLQHERAKEIFGAATPRYGWHYPPLFHFIAAPLATMPYLVSLAVWQGITLALYLIAIRSIVSSWPGLSRPSTTSFQATAKDVDARHIRASTPVFDGTMAGHDGAWLLLALAFPAVFVNLGHGHNGFLTAALLGFALLWLDQRPIVAGILFGLLAYKPQFGLMIPLVLAASGRWRTVPAAGVTVALLALAVALVFGLDTWRAFFASAGFSREVLETGGRWHMIQSVYSWVRLWGGGISLAYAIQSAVTLVVAATLIWLWRSPADFALKAAALCLGTILAIPYSLDYDMMVFAPAIAFLAMHGARRGFAPYEITALAALWLVPLVARSVAQATMIPIGVLVTAAAFALIVQRVRAEPVSRSSPAYP
jgi:alpha-1,2-mannosyltransferase